MLSKIKIIWGRLLAKFFKRQLEKMLKTDLPDDLRKQVEDELAEMNALLSEK